MTTTLEWATAKGVDVADVLPPVDGYDKPISHTAGNVARRTIILHSVAAAGYGVDRGPIVEWLNAESIWQHVSTNERRLLTGTDVPKTEFNDACWRQEAQWALLWAIAKIESLGLPTKTCDTSMLVDSIMPGLGESTDSFIASARMRPTGELLAEDDRVYNLHCYARQAHRENSMPTDLLYPVLFQRHHAFEWLTGDADWDAVRTDT